MKALSIRQPWAWLIIHGPKRWENRDWQPRNPALRFRGRCLIHAAVGMTGAEYAAAYATLEDYNDARIVPPAPRICLPEWSALHRGGIIGAVTVVDWRDQRDPSDPFSLGSGLVLADPQPLPFYRCKGALGFFNVDLPAELNLNLTVPE